MTIYRGPGGGGNADSDAEINALTALTNQALAYSETAGLEADAAAVAAGEAASSAFAAASSASAASTSASGAATSASSASGSASSASTSATNAATSASSASTSATNAASSESAAATSATNAASSASSAATSASGASTSATAAAGSAVSAAASASSAATQASNAADSATAAATSATNASTSASAAATSATAASGSASAAATSAANALASETAAAASVASIDLPTIVRTTGDQTIGGIKTFSSTIVGSVNGNAATVTAVTPSQVSDQANTSTGFFDLPVGTTAQRGSPTSGAIRFNTDTPGYEGYNGSAWGSLGGGNTTTKGLWENANSITADYTIGTNNNATSAGPISVATGVVVTVPTGSRWVVL